MAVFIKRESNHLKTIGKNVDKLQELVAKVGWFPGNNYTVIGKDGKTMAGPPVAYVAAIMEHGDPAHNLPPRSFIRATIAKKEQAWKKKGAALAKKVIAGEINEHDFFEAAGFMVQADIQQAITKLTEPALSAATIAARKRQISKGKSATAAIAKPLVFTGLLLNSLTTVVGKE